MNISSMIKQLTESYKEMSIECLQNLCMEAGVQYREPKDAVMLINDFHSKGYRIKVMKYTHEDESVGQYIILADLYLNVIKGFRIWIDFDGYVVRKETFTTNESAPFLKDSNGAVN
jgi:hypothetical protein